jgi:hypothetical protein
MKRLTPGAWGRCVAGILLGLAGCDSGSVERGIPTDTTPPISLDDLWKMGGKTAGTSPSAEVKTATEPATQATERPIQTQ